MRRKAARTAHTAINARGVRLRPPVLGGMKLGNSGGTWTAAAFPEDGLVGGTGATEGSDSRHSWTLVRGSSAGTGQPSVNSGCSALLPPAFPYFPNSFVRYLSLTPNRRLMPGEKLAEARITSKGQITLPKKVQKILGVAQGDYVLFYQEDGRLVIVGGSVRPKK